MDASNYVIGCVLAQPKSEDIYGPSEDLYGRFLKQKNDASHAYGFTKFVPRPGPMPRNVVEPSINRSLQKMGVSVLDMVQFHWWDYEDERYLEVVKALTEGKILEVALTNFDIFHVNRILSSGCLNNVKLLAYGTLLGGFISEKYFDKHEPKRVELNTSSLAKYKYVIDQWGEWNLFQELLLVLKRLAEKYGISISNIAVRYIADKRAIGIVIIGARLSIAEHIADNSRTFSFLGLDADDVSLIQAVVHKGRRLIGDCGDNGLIKKERSGVVSLSLSLR
ncbi:hypothetical protein KP509_03G055900 [Ceratopteris richardii]|uniref:NADP-dependent oxidoreductase domain-containing protein n=1 Tax=Ceratopteris richardii TaxID=49495 RepID=A0A8T2V026_CERRI|nr:hypothetical protein KP509_03G055900 [Ceratopteris richardii]